MKREKSQLQLPLEQPPHTQTRKEEEEKMPKNAGESQSKLKMRLKSMRKPLRDVSNAKAANKSASIYNKISKDDGGKAGGDSLDRLLLVHSELRRQVANVEMFWMVIIWAFFQIWLFNSFYEV